MEASFITKYPVLWLLIVSAFLLQPYTSRCCLEQEKVALLHLKSYFMSISSESHRYVVSNVSNELRSWSGDGEDNCCMWKRVKCGSPMQHVTELSLDSLQWFTPFVDLNVTVFQPFAHLTHLDLSSNNIFNLLECKGNKTSSLRNIEILNLSENSLVLDEVTDIVGSLTKLKNLNFSQNLNCSGLGLQGLSHLKWLQVLDCGDQTSMYEYEEIPCQALGNMTSLQVLDLTHGLYKKIVHAEGLCKLSNLQELRLPESGLVGTIPKCFWNLTSLRTVDFYQNSLSGTLPTFINLPSLRQFVITYNNFQGKISLNFLMNHSRLEVLLLSYNDALEVQIEDGPGSSSSKLQLLDLSQCNLTGQATTLEKILSYQSNMVYIGLSSNRLTGSFPTSLLLNNSNLKYLNLRNNSFSGSFQLPQHTNMSLSSLDISSNKFRGRLPNHIGTLLSSLNSLNMSFNSLEGHIPASVGNMTQLMTLDLSDNKFSGELPIHLFSDCTLLSYLVLSKNNLDGEIIPSSLNSSMLHLLYLDNNNFGGTIRESTNISRWLCEFDISNNKAAGELPSWVGELRAMESMSVAGNEFHGHIPSRLCNLTGLRSLDLSKNRFTGRIPSCDGLSKLSFLHMHGNSLIGAIPVELAKCSNLVTLDLSNNKLSGGIPSWIDKLSSLVILLLGGNQLGGGLPVQLCRLQHVNIIDVSENSISGVLPSCLRNMSFGTLEMKSYAPTYASESTGLPWIKNVYYIHYFDTKVFERQEEVEFTVKSRYISYKGHILSIMSELDLSCNNLVGDIPAELGELGMINALNLSHNSLSGSIPRSFSKLKNVESLDLSSNNLSGQIPSDLADLTFLEIFNVSYNNLSGQVPETGQFGSFDERNYRGNPLLCGSQLPRRCGIDETIPQGSTSPDEEGDAGFDMEVFIWSFSMSSVIVLLSFIVVLAINPYWRRAWFAFIDVKFLWWLRP